MPTRRVSTRVRRTSPRQGPRAPEHLVERMVVAAIGMVNAYTDRLMRALGPLLEERYGSRQDQRQDAASQHPGKGGLDAVFERVPEGELTHGFLERMFVMVDRQAADDLQRVVPVPLKELLPNANELQKQWVERNSQLIRLEERAQQEVARILDAPIREGVRVEEIRKQIEQRMGVVRSRAELIARDQTLKLYGQVQQERQTEAGIVEYTWSTSEDERVRGNPAGLYPKSHGNHWKLEGTTQRWDSPPLVDEKAGRREHPGGDFQCRCAAIPILPVDELRGEEPANDVPGNGVPGNDVPANDVPPRRPVSVGPFTPEEQQLAEPLPPPVDPVEQERQRLAEERAQREAEREAARRAEEERARQALAERERLARAASPREILQRYAERVQISTSTPHETRAAAASAVEHVGLGGLNLVKITPDLGVARAEGLYFAPNADLKLKSAGFQALGKALPETPGPGKVWSMGTQPGTQAEAARNTMYHELGHHAHLLGSFAAKGPDRALGIKIDRLIQDRWHASDREYLTDYAQDLSTPPHQRAAEYFAEAFAAYHAAPDWLARVAPKAHALVAHVLELRKASP